MIDKITILNKGQKDLKGYYKKILILPEINFT